MPYLDISGLRFENNIIKFKTNTPNLSASKISWKKQKCLYLGPKILICVPYSWAGIWKHYCHIWNHCPRICLVAKFGAKIKTFKFGTKSPWFRYFWVGIWKYSCHIWNHRPWICLIEKFGAKIKILNLVPKMPYLGIFGLEFENNIDIFEISTLEFV